MRSSGGAHTSGTDDNKPVGQSQEDTAAAPDLEQATTPEEEVTLQAPPETQVTAPPAAPTRKIAPAENHSDAKQVASPFADAAAGPTEIGATGLQVLASAEKAAAQLNTATATAGQWTDQPVAATFTTPLAPASRAPEPEPVPSTFISVVADLIGAGRAPGPTAPPESPVLWAVLGWVRRQFTEALANHTPVADLVQTTQIEPLEIAEAALVEAPPTTSIFFESSPRIGEANGTVMVPIVRTGDLTRVSTIEYGITPDTATAGVDYLGGNGTITMNVGVDRVVIPVQILNDTLSEPTETFVVSIINVDSGSTILFPRTARIDILDDETPVVDPPSPPLTSNYNVTQQVVVSGINQPLAFEFARHDPSLIYVAEKGGVIKVFNVNTGAQQSTFIDISSKVNNIQDRGLMDIVLHPNFGQPVQPGQPEHNYVYAFYVVDPPDTVGNPSANALPDGGGNRFAYLVRFTANAATNYTTAVPGSEVILLGGAGRTLQDISGAGAVDSTSAISQPESGFNAQTRVYVDNYIKVDSRSHAGGSLAFGPDGALYVSIGDGTSFNTTDPRTVSVQNINSLSGKILRIDPITGLGLPDNPFVEPGDDLSANHSKVYQLGLRNPFSIGFAQDGRLLITNTGWNSWEEIESGHAGANFGWPYYEGGDNGVLQPAPGYQNLPSDAARGLPSAAGFYAAVANGTITITPAYRAFAHSESAPGFQIGAIVGVDAAYSGERYPAEFQNDVFFTDVNTGRVFVVDVNNRSDVKFLYSTQAAPVAFRQGPDGYVYAANLGGNTITRLLIQPIQPPNSPPVAVNDVRSTPAGTAVVIAALANDSDPDSNPLTITAVSNVVGGTATINNPNTPNNTITYTPAAGFSGAGGFTYTVSDGTAQASAQVAVTVTPPGNSPPVAVNDVRSTPAGTAVVIAALANDSDPDSNPLTITAVSNVVGGTATINNPNTPNNTITYTPAAGFSGAGGFTYTVSDGTAQASAQVAVTVTPPSVVTLTPHGSASVSNGVFTLTTATANQKGTTMSTGRIDVRQDFTVAFEVNLGSNDGGADGAAIVFHNDPRGVNAIGTHGGGLAVGGIQNGLAIEFDTYNSTAASLVSLGMPGFDIASDHTGFLGTNSAFASTPVPLANIENGAWHPVVVTWNAATQTLSYTFDGQPMGTPLTSNIATQFFGGSNFAYLGFGAGTGSLSNTQSVRNISVTATLEGQAPGNSPPVAVNDVRSTPAGTAVVIAALANDSDPDSNPLTITAVSNVVGGTATINNPNTPNNTITYTPAAGFSGAGGFTYTVSDGTAQASAQVAVTVTPPGNSPPVAVNDVRSTPAGTAVVIAALANDSDPDSNPLTITAVSNVVGGTATINNPNTPNNTITYTPAAGFSGAGGFTYTVSDGTAQASAQVAVTVTPPSVVTLTPHGSASVSNGVFTLTTATANQKGTTMSTGRIDVRQDFTVAFEVNLGSNDGGADGAAIVFHNDPRGVNAIGTHGGGLAVGGIQNGLAIEFDTYNSTAASLVSLGMPGFDIASDHTGFLGTNSAFASTPVPLANIENGAWHPVVVTWNAATQTLSYTFDGQPMGTPLTSNIATQFFGGSNFAYLGFGAGTGSLSNTQSVRNISVTATLEGQAPGNSPPVAVNDVRSTPAGTAVVIAALANDSDPDSNPLTITAVSNVVGGTATINNPNTPNNTITYTPAAGFSGAGGFTYTVSDGTAQASAQVAVTVTPPGNSPPVAVNDVRSTPAGTAVVIAALANDSDPDSNPLTITAVSNVVGGTATINNPNTPNNTITYTPAAGFSGAGGFTYTVSDGTAQASAQVAVTVTPPSVVTLTPHGSASVSNGVFTLTTATANQKGTTMSTGRIDVRQDFTVAFEVNLGSNDGGADGAAIVFHNDPRGVNAIGTHGGGLAVGGIQNGLAIEFDTYNSTAASLVSLGMPGFDIASDHTGFLGTNSAFASTPVPLANIENGAWHPVVVTWNAATQTLSYTFDGQPMGTPLTSNIATQFFGGSNFAYLGFGAGTGSLSNTQSVRNISVTATLEGQAPTLLAIESDPNAKVAGVVAL